jgi:hypothetical protein
MKTARFTAAVAIAGLALSPAYAAASQGKGGASPKAHGPTTHAQAPTTHAAPQAPATHGKAPTTTHGNPHTTTKASSPTTTTKAHGNPHTTTATDASGATAPAPTAGAAATTSTTTLNPIAEKLNGKPLASRIEQMTGMTLNAASDGFRNQGQFIAAVHVSQNLGIPFADLKATMLGTPLPGSTLAATSPMSLGQAIQQLKPFANSTTEATRAEKQAATDLRTTTTSTTNATTPTTTTTTKKSKTRRR